MIMHSPKMLQGAPRVKEFSTNIKGGNWSLCVRACKHVCVYGFHVHIQYLLMLTVSAMFKLLLSSSQSQAGWLWVDWATVSLAAEQECRANCLISAASKEMVERSRTCLPACLPACLVIHFRTQDRPKSVGCVTKWTELLGILLTADGVDGN